MFYETIPGLFISEMCMNHENYNRMTIILKWFYGCFSSRIISSYYIADILANI